MKVTDLFLADYKISMGDLHSKIIQFKNVSRYFQAGSTRVTALSEVCLELNSGDFATIVGPSGGGKTTLLNVLGGLDRPDEGEVFLKGREVFKMSDEELTSLRRHEIGFIFQFFNLMPTMTVWENVELPLLLNHSMDDGKKKIGDLIEYVGLDKRVGSFPAELSGGEMQRVAIARALVHEPSLILADEPTGNLDSENGRRILDLMMQVSSDFKSTLVMVTHNPQAAKYGNRHFQIKDGVLKTINF